jgi:hypothetical protein
MQPVPRRCASESHNGEQGVAAEWDCLWNASSIYSVAGKLSVLLALHAS